MPAETQNDASRSSGGILLVEDNAGDVALVREAMKAQSLDNQQLIVMRDGELAIRYMDDVDRGQVPCLTLVILDLNLPRRSGSEVLRRIRSSPVCGNVVVMVLSSSEAAKDKIEMASLGADRYIRKPANLDELVQLGVALKEMFRSANEPRN